MQKTILTILFVVSLFIPQFSFAQTESEGEMVNTCVQLTSARLTRGYYDAQTDGQVSLLQDFLIEKGLLNTSTGGPTGYYGNQTTLAVKAYQASRGISQVGTVGPMTKAAIALETGCGNGGTTPTNTTNTTSAASDSSCGVLYQVRNAAGNCVDMPTMVNLKVNGTSGPIAVEKGTQLNFTWTSNRPVTGCRAGVGFIGGFDASQSQGTSGTIQQIAQDVYPSGATKSYSYSISCLGGIYNNSFVWSNNVTVSVLSSSAAVTTSTSVTNFTATATTTATTGNSTLAPTILFFDRGSSSYTSVQPVTVTWAASNAASCAITALAGGVSTVTSGLASSGSRMFYPIRDTKYTLVCRNSAGVVSTPVERSVYVSTTTASSTTSITNPTATSGATTDPVLLSFDRGSSSYISGQPVTLTWASSNTASCALTALVGSISTVTSGLSSTGSKVLYPTKNTIYSLVCRNSAGVASRTIERSVYVSSSATSTPTTSTPAVPDSLGSGSYIVPSIRYLAVDPAGPLVYGQTTKLMWDTNDARDDSCSLGIRVTTPSGTVTNGTIAHVNAEGILNNTPLIGTTMYTLTCKGYDSSVSKQVSISVASSSSSQAASLEPTILTFNRGSSSVISGQPLTLTWTTSNALTCSINVEPQKGGEPSVTTGIAVNGSKVYYPTQDTKYTLTCANNAGVSKPFERTVYVSSPSVLGASTVCVDLPINMHRGYESYGVTKLQEFLKLRNFMGEVTGFYGDKTVVAVKEYQASRGLPVTGMTYDFTRSAIKGETCQ